MIATATRMTVTITGLMPFLDLSNQFIIYPHNCGSVSFPNLVVQSENEHCP